MRDRDRQVRTTDLRAEVEAKQLVTVTVDLRRMFAEDEAREAY